MQKADTSEQESRRNALIRLRHRLGVPQAKIALTIGINRGTLSLWECGYRVLPDSVVDAIAECLAREFGAIKLDAVNELGREAVSA